jgi:hypothetical protein
MNPITATALGILGACAVALVLLGVYWDVQDRKPLNPPLPEVKPEHKPRHADWGPTTKLQPPPRN